MGIQKAIEELYRQQHSKMVAALITYFGFQNIETAEDLVQDTFVAAAENWATIPENPNKWLYKVCKNKALNQIKKDKKVIQGSQPDDGYSLAFDDTIDHELKLLSLCCDKRLAKKAQMIFTLHTFMGFTFYEISEALGMHYDAVNKHHQRVLQKLKSTGFLIEKTEENILPDKLHDILHVLYLIFNEGYKASTGNVFIQKDLCYQALRLVKVLSADPRYVNSEILGLYSLFIFHTARFDARIDKEGIPLLLEEQDRKLWDEKFIKAGIRSLNESIRLATNIPSRYTLEAAIASIHCKAKNFADTDWKLIVSYYAIIAVHYPSTFVIINYAIALLYGYGSEEAKEKLKEIPENDFLSMHYSRYALLAKIEEIEGDFNKSAEYLQRAIFLCRNESETSALQKRLERIRHRLVPGIYFTK